MVRLSREDSATLIQKVMRGSYARSTLKQTAPKPRPPELELPHLQDMHSVDDLASPTSVGPAEGHGAPAATAHGGRVEPSFEEGVIERCLRTAFPVD